MAARRMFAKAVVGSGRFLRLPVKSRLLYYDLGMDADDDGAVDALSVLRKTGATERDLEPLIDNDFVTVLSQEFVVVYINDWKRNNLIRKDRYTEGLYRSLVEQAIGQPDDNQRLTDGQPNDNQRLTQARIGQSSLDKDRVDKGNQPRLGGPGFSIPSVESVEQYCQRNGLNVDVKRFWHYYDERGWTTSDGEPVRAWKALLHNWHKTELKGVEDHADSGRADAGSPAPGGKYARFTGEIL